MSVEWWSLVCQPNGIRRKAMESLLMLVVWEIWNKCITHGFFNTPSMHASVFAKIKREASNWGLPGAKYLRSLMRERDLVSVCVYLLLILF